MSDSKRPEPAKTLKRPDVPSQPPMERSFSNALANSLPGIVYLFDQVATLLWWNRNMERVTGYTTEELVGAPMAQFVPERHQALVQERYLTAMQSGEAWVEVPLLLKNGDEVPYHFTGHRVEFGGAPCLVGMGIDITERDRIERRRSVRLAVPQVLAQAKTLAEAAPHLLQGICEGLGWDVGVVWTVDGNVLRCLDVWHAPSLPVGEFETVSRRMTLPPGAGLPGCVWRSGKAIWIADVAFELSLPRAALAAQAGLHGTFAFPIRITGGVLGVIEFFSRRVREPDADLLEFMATVGGQIGQFLERHEAEVELRRSEARKAAILEAALDCIITVDHEERVIEFNPAAEKTFGYPRTAALGRTLSELIIPPRLRAAQHRDLSHYLATGVGPALGRRVELPALRADGAEFPAEISIVPTILDGKPILTCYLRDITERKQAEEVILQLNRDLEARVAQRTAELSAANEALARAAKSKDEFLATVSHELRTPLSGVLGMVNLLAETPLDDQQRRYALTARTSADLLLGVINDILDFSRIESGKFDLDPVGFNPATVVDEVVSVLSMQAQEKGLPLQYQVDPGVDQSFHGDRRRLRQILVNLVANAVKFTEQGEVAVRVSKIEDRESRIDSSVCLRFEVQDTGIGIPPDRLEQLFQPFSQVDASTTRRFGGSGLGLAIARRLTQMMGGEIGVESELGKGSTFWFTVVLDSARRPPDELAGSGTAGPAGSTPRGLRVLVAEDNEANQMVAGALLEKMGHTVRFAANGREAVAAFAQEPFDLVLMDVQMPEMDGLQATTTIRAQEVLGQHTPIVGVTAHVVRGDVDPFLASGMDAYLFKPVRREELSRVIEEVLGLSLPTVAKPALQTVPLDRTTILARLEGDEPLLRELIEMYRRDWPLLHADIQRALQGDDLAAAALKAHRLNGLARNFETGAVVRTAARLEDLARAGELAQAKLAGDELLKHCQQLEVALQRLRT